MASTSGNQSLNNGCNTGTHPLVIFPFVLDWIDRPCTLATFILYLQVVYFLSMPILVIMVFLHHGIYLWHTDREPCPTRSETHGTYCDV